MASLTLACQPHCPDGFTRALAHNMPSKFPEIQGGGSLILAWQIKNKNVLVVGGGEVSLYVDGLKSSVNLVRSPQVES